jgi:prepilin-type N-terminal cleavage/methylation domain-containing protein/prepilin-type processing-associated H-X9-DG protein
MKREPRYVRCPKAESNRFQIELRVPTSLLFGPGKFGRARAKAREMRAFSLIELLITVLIILVLTTMYWGGNSASRQKARLGTCQQNLQKIFIAMQIYATEHSAKYPAKTGAKLSEEPLDRLVPHYTSDTSSFICPGSKDSNLSGGESILKRKISYAYYMGRTSTDGAQEALMSDRQVDTQSKSQNQALFSTTGKPPGNNHKQFGGNILFCDGHADHSDPRSSFSLVVTQGIVLLNP